MPGRQDAGCSQVRKFWFEYWAAAFWQTSWHLIIKWSVLPIDDDDLPPTFEATSGVPWGTADDFYKKGNRGVRPLYGGWTKVAFSRLMNLGNLYHAGLWRSE